jgi:hypothetical protein
MNLSDVIAEQDAAERARLLGLAAKFYRASELAANEAYDRIEAISVIQDELLQYTDNTDITESGIDAILAKFHTLKIRAVVDPDTGMLR